MVVGGEKVRLLHLNDEAYGPLITLGQTVCQAVEMLYAPLGGGVREVDGPVPLQGNPLDLDKALAGPGLPVKIKAGVPVTALRFE